MLISSRQNPKVKDAAKLQIKKYRDKEQKFLAEGYYPISFALNNNYPLEKIFVCSTLLKDKFNNGELVRRLSGKKVETLKISESVYAKISSSTSPEGLLAIAPQKHLFLKHHRPEKNCLYLVAESIEKLTALGALFRLADNAGASGIVLCNMKADMYNPEVIRSSLGTFFSVNAWQSTTEEAIAWFRRNKIKTLATSPGAVTNYTKVDLADSIAIVLGTEYTGLTADWLKKADLKIKIPMYGQANSLSVVAAAAVMLYEAVRQRQESPGWRKES